MRSRGCLLDLGSIAHLRTEPKLRSDELGFFGFRGALNRRHCKSSSQARPRCLRNHDPFYPMPKYGMTFSHVSIQTADFNLGQEVAALRAEDPRVGAVCSFIGTVRDRNAGQAGEVQTLELEHYPGMTEKSIEGMIAQARQRFDILGTRVVHRVGLLQPLDQIVLVAVTSAHRGESFKACEFLMDYLKTQAPFWKKEQTPAGAQWVDARVTDDAALARWGIQATPNA